MTLISWDKMLPLRQNTHLLRWEACLMRNKLRLVTYLWLSSACTKCSSQGLYVVLRKCVQRTVSSTSHIFNYSSFHVQWIRFSFLYRHSSGYSNKLSNNWEIVSMQWTMGRGKRQESLPPFPLLIISCVLSFSSLSPASLWQKEDSAGERELGLYLIESQGPVCEWVST